MPDDKSPASPRLLTCICNVGFHHGLTVGRLYSVLPDPGPIFDDYVRVIDDGGEDCLCPSSYFAKPFPWKCYTCRERAIYQVVLPVYETELTHDGTKYPISIPDLAVCQCRQCGSIMLTDGADDRVSNSLRLAAGLLMPNEISKARLAAGLTPGELAEAMGVPVSTVERWEAGHQIQAKDMDSRLREALTVSARGALP